jgi:hypothetical protein
MDLTVKDLYPKKKGELIKDLHWRQNLNPNFLISRTLLVFFFFFYKQKLNYKKYNGYSQNPKFDISLFSKF